MSRHGLGFEGERDSILDIQLSQKQQAALFNESRSAGSRSIRGALRTAPASRIGELSADCQIVPHPGNLDRQTLPIEYPSSFQAIALLIRCQA